MGDGQTAYAGRYEPSAALSRSRLRGHVSNKGKTQKEAVEAISSLSDRQFSIVAEIAPLFGTQFRTTNIFGGIAVQPRDHQSAKIRFTRPYIH